MLSTTPDLPTRGSGSWRAVLEGILAVVLLASLVGGVAGALVWGLLRAAGTLVP